MMLGDHVTITPDVQGRYPAPFYDPFTTLGWLAGLTRRVELGFTVIVLPYRHPLETARMAATLDRISGGRLIFGIGVGWARQEFEVLGLPFERRGAMTDDYLGALKAAWTQDVASYQGPLRVVQGHLHRAAPAAAARTRRSGWAARATRRCGAPCATATPGTRSGAASRSCATRGCRSSAPSPSRRAARCPRSARASVCA